MGDMVASALVQEGVSRASSYVSSKREEKASREHLAVKLKMALSHLEFALEMSRKVPITCVSLLGRLKDFKIAYVKGVELLKKHNQQVLENQQRQQAVTRHSFIEWFRGAKNLPISSLFDALNNDCLSSSAVERFEWYAAEADKFVAQVDLGCSLRRNIFPYPLVKQLLERKTLWYNRMEGSKTCRLFIIPTFLEERGVEAWLFYTNVDMERPEKCFWLHLILRLSEDTNIVGIAIKCLQSLTSQFKLVTNKSSIGELSLLHEVQDISHSYAPPLGYSQEIYTEVTEVVRTDPICCTDNVVSSHGVPEKVIGIGFACYIAGTEYMFHTSTEGLSINLPPLYMETFFNPHSVCKFPPRISHRCVGEVEEDIDGSIELMEEILRTKAINCVVHRPEPTRYDVMWLSPHGAARITLCNSCDDPEWPKLTAAPRLGMAMGRVWVGWSKNPPVKEKYSGGK